MFARAVGVRCGGDGNDDVDDQAELELGGLVARLHGQRFPLATSIAKKNKLEEIK
jgi:hypothetical protein